jgi:hypothetical protein
MCKFSGLLKKNVLLKQENGRLHKKIRKLKAKI